MIRAGQDDHTQTFGALTLSVQTPVAQPCPPSPTSACLGPSSTSSAANGIETPFPIQAATLPDSLARPRRTRPRPDRIRQDIRVPFADGDATHSEPDQARRLAVRGHSSSPRPVSSSPRSTRRSHRWPPRRTCARSPSSAASPRSRRSRSCGRASTSSSPAPAAWRTMCGPRHADLSASRDHRARRGRPHGGPRLPAAGEAAAWTRHRATVSECCSRRHSTAVSTSSSSGTCATPLSTASIRRSRRSPRWIIMSCTSIRRRGSACSPTSPRRRAGRSSSPAPSTAPRILPAS